MRSAVDLHLTPLPWQVSPWVSSNRSATPWANEDLLDCSFAVRADGVLWGGEGLSPERKACLESAKTEAERMACNNAAAIRADQEGE